MARMSGARIKNHEAVDNNEEQVSETMTSIFPNPAKTVITIWSDVERPIRVKSVNGSNIVQSELKRGDNQFNIADWPSGVYLFYMGAGAEVKKVVKE
jgi:hypothetical protein